jgi:hypothetical protein
MLNKFRVFIVSAFHRTEPKSCAATKTRPRKNNLRTSPKCSFSLIIPDELLNSATQQRHDMVASVMTTVTIWERQRKTKLVFLSQLKTLVAEDTQLKTLTAPEDTQPKTLTAPEDTHNRRHSQLKTLVTEDTQLKTLSRRHSQHLKTLTTEDTPEDTHSWRHSQQLKTLSTWRHSQPKTLTAAEDTHSWRHSQQLKTLTAEDTYSNFRNFSSTNIDSSIRQSNNESLRIWLKEHIKHRNETSSVLDEKGSQRRGRASPTRFRCGCVRVCVWKGESERFAPPVREKERGEGVVVTNFRNEFRKTAKPRTREDKRIQQNCKTSETNQFGKVSRI